MEWLFIPVGLLFTLLGAACLVLIVLGLPGVWILLALAAIIELADSWYLPGEEPQTFGWWLLLAAAGVALVGEGLEFAASMLGAKKGGSSRRGMWGALIGGVIGVFLFAVPIPVIGIFIGAVIGKFVGAIVGEMSHERASFRGSIKPATGATIGRVLGTVGKLGVALGLWLSLSVLALWP